MIITKIALKDHYEFLGEDGRNPLLTVYLPEVLEMQQERGDKRASIVICPGGGYSICCDREAEPIALHFLSEGYNAFVLDYSVAPNRFPTQLREVAAVMDMIYKNAHQWRCDTEKIAIIGFSAGGHLAAHYSTCFDIPEVREVFPQSHSVNGTILAYPVITAEKEIRHTGSFINLLGREPDEADIQKFSCEKQVNENTPPAFMWHTSEDRGVPAANSMLYAAALAKYNIPYEMHIYPYGWHGLATADYITNNEIPPKMAVCADWLDAVKAWVKRTFDIK